MATDPDRASLRDRIAGWFVKPAYDVFAPEPQGLGLSPGAVLHVVREVDGRMARYHLRIEPDGTGLLVVNAATAVRLPPHTTGFAAETFRRNAPGAAVPMSVDISIAPRDENEATDAFMRLWQHPHEASARYPIADLITSPKAKGAGARFAAPLEADLPLPDPAQVGPLLDALWAAGIPHVTFLAPPGFTPEQLVRAVERAEDTGMIAGVRACGADLASGVILEALAQAGVDHVNVPFASTDAATHDALFGEGDLAAARAVLERVRALEICPVAEVPLVESTVPDLRRTLAALADLVADVECFAVAAPDDLADADRSGALSARSLPQVAATLEDLAETLDLGLVWAPPVRRDPSSTLAAQVVAGPRCAGDVAVAVLADGSVIPPRGPLASAGNILVDAWESIWSDPAFALYRGETPPPARCEICPGLAVCLTGCPRDGAGWTWGEV